MAELTPAELAGSLRYVFTVSSARLVCPTRSRTVHYPSARPSQPSGPPGNVRTNQAAASA